MQMAGDLRAYYIVLSPDPVHYFYHHFKKYPVIKISYRDSADDFLALMKADPGGSPADAVRTNWSESVIFVPGGKWFSRLLQSADDNGEHLWIPGDWVDRVTASHPSLRIE